MTTAYVPFSEVLAESLKDPETKAEWERTQASRDLAVEILRQRGERGMSQRKFASLLGMKQQQAARLELGEVLPTIQTMQRISQALGIGISIIILPNDSPSIAFN